MNIAANVALILFYVPLWLSAKLLIFVLDFVPQLLDSISQLGKSLQRIQISYYVAIAEVLKEER